VIPATAVRHHHERFDGSGLSEEQALDEIAQAAGSHFDPDLVAAISPRSFRSAMRPANAEMP
jgi:HD-GYP domain-containing protein (c-di-GMP phosphodiesterase class II)